MTCGARHPLYGKRCVLEEGHTTLHSADGKTFSGMERAAAPYQDPAPAFTLREDMDAAQRKARPVYSGVLLYFPDALLEVAYTSYIGNEQHNPGQPLHWAKEKSKDELDALIRHTLDAGGPDKDGVLHDAKVAWRALANLQRRIDAIRAARAAKRTEGL